MWRRETGGTIYRRYVCVCVEDEDVDDDTSLQLVQVAYFCVHSRASCRYLEIEN